MLALCWLFIAAAVAMISSMRRATTRQYPRAATMMPRRNIPLVQRVHSAHGAPLSMPMEQSIWFPALFAGLGGSSSDEELAISLEDYFDHLPQFNAFIEQIKWSDSGFVQILENSGFPKDIQEELFKLFKSEGRNRTKFITAFQDSILDKYLGMSVQDRAKLFENNNNGEQKNILYLRKCRFLRDMQKETQADPRILRHFKDIFEDLGYDNHWTLDEFSSDLQQFRRPYWLFPGEIELEMDSSVPYHNQAYRRRYSAEELERVETVYKLLEEFLEDTEQLHDNCKGDFRREFIRSL